MKQILLPTDFSDNSWNAIKYAVQLFKNEACTFHLFNAYTPIIYHVDYVFTYPVQFGMGDVSKEASLLSLNKLLDRISNDFGNNPNHKFEIIARFDALTPGVKDLIDERHVDMVVMGTKGATGAKEVLFGSNTVHVFKEVKCPILAIPSNFNYETPHEILFPTDFEVDYKVSPITLLNDLAHIHKARLNIMHVSNGYDLSEVQEKNRLDLESIFNNSAYLFHDIEMMDINDAINKFQIKAKINLLAMINNKHSFFENLFFESTIHKIGFHLNIPFLVIPLKTT